MCKSNYEADRLVSKDLTVLAAPGDAETQTTIDQYYGNIIGISIGETYPRTELGKVNLTLKYGSEEVIINTPLTQFLPDGERQMWPLRDEPVANQTLTAKLSIRTNTLSVNTPIPLILHCRRKKTC